MGDIYSIVFLRKRAEGRAGKVKMSNYDKYPKTKVAGTCIRGYLGIHNHLQEEIKKGKFVLVAETYPGVNDEEVIPELKKLNPDLFINMQELFKDEKTIVNQLKYNITEDRVFGKMYFGDIIDFIDEEKLSQAKQQVQENDGFALVYGFGAALVAEADCLVYLDMARWEIQQRYRSGMPNYNSSNIDEDVLRKYKRGFFIEWRIADKHKQKLFDKIDFLLDTNVADDPKMITGAVLREGLENISRRPFRTVPYFDPGVWGGQWMKEVCDLDRSKENFAWSFDGVPEENSLYLDVAGIQVEIPAMDLVLYKPKNLLGEKVFARFGAEFPIRFDFLDTMGGQNLSLQVHPLTEYIRKQFGMAYTQDESYYILDAEEDAIVYLGVKDNINPDEMIAELYKAQEGEIIFDADKYINKFPAKKHDHFLIPAGTCHCSGKNAMVLEISATAYIFTFKLWDWERLGLDGRPRPVHINHGKKVIQWDRTTDWVKENLINCTYTVREDEHVKEEHTGLHELEFIETRRIWMDAMSEHDTKGTVNVLNLIEGQAAVIESPDNSFEPFVVHYAETFMIPATVGRYTIRPYGESENKKIAVIKAYVRGTEN